MIASIMRKKYLSLINLIYMGLFSLAPGLLYAAEVQGGPASIDKNPVGLVNVLQIMTYLILVIVIIIGSAWIFRRFGRVNSAVNGNLKVIAGLSVGQRERIVLVAAGDVHLLLGVAPGHVQTLHVMDGDSIGEVANSKNVNTGKESFINRFNNEIRKKMLS